jgi:hypothetical protein
LQLLNGISKTMSKLERLAREALSAVERNESVQEMDDQILLFLSEDSIIERTKNCDRYFEEFVTPLAATVKVKLIRHLWVKPGNTEQILDIYGLWQKSSHVTGF